MPVELIVPLPNNAERVLQISKAKPNAIVNKARSEFSRVLGLPEKLLSVDGRYVKGGKERKGFPSDVSAHKFAVELQGTVVVGTPAAVNQWPARVCWLEEEMQKLRTRVLVEGALLEEANTRGEALAVTNAALQQRKVLLKKAWDGYRDIIRRHVVKSVVAKLGLKFRHPREGERWNSYVLAVRDENTDWFAERGFDVNISLLLKGQGTPFEAGNDAAHVPADDVVEDFVASEPIWVRLWKFAKTGD